MTGGRTLHPRMFRQARVSRGRAISRALLCFALAGCDACPGQAPAVATLIEREGTSVERDFSDKREQWSQAELGEKFRLGDGLRTHADANAHLALNDGSQLQVRPKTTIRFFIDGTGEREQGVDLVTGEAVVRAGKSSLWLRTHVGLAMLNPGSRLILTRLGLQLGLEVEVGTAHFRDGRGNDVQLQAGEKVLLEVGMAVLQRGVADGAGGPAPPPPANAISAMVLRGGVRARERGREGWHDLTPGDHPVAEGTGLRLAEGAELELKRGPERARLFGAGDYVVGEGGALVTAQRGTVRVFAETRDVEVRVPGGTIVARAANGGSEAELRVADNAGELSVKRGQASFSGPEGNVEVGVGAAHRWTYGAQPDDDEADEPEAEKPPEYSNLEVRAGESFVVHAPEVPVAIAFDFSRKCKRGQVDLAQPKRRAAGDGRANLLVPAGARAYSVRCADARGKLGRVVLRGTAHILQDAGTRKLPLRAPTSLVDADGHSYTIYYQNQLPQVRVRWPNAPEADSYQLDLNGTTMAVSSPEYLFESGSLRDGVHRLTFKAGARQSRTANVEVRFDNTTATASLTAPVDRSFKVGDTVSIEGLALPAWAVSVRDGTIEKAGADRFQGQVVTTEGRPDIAVRLAHPRLGTHYYLRRAASSQ
jgi:hypothetical protein